MRFVLKSVCVVLESHLPASLLQFSSPGVLLGWPASSEAGSLLLTQCILFKNLTSQFSSFFLFWQFAQHSNSQSSRLIHSLHASILLYNRSRSIVICVVINIICILNCSSTISSIWNTLLTMNHQRCSGSQILNQIAHKWWANKSVFAMKHPWQSCQCCWSVCVSARISQK